MSAERDDVRSWPLPRKTVRQGLPQASRVRRVGSLCRMHVSRGRMHAILAVRSLPGVRYRCQSSASVLFVRAELTWCVSAALERGVLPDGRNGAHALVQEEARLGSRVRTRRVERRRVYLPHPRESSCTTYEVRNVCAQILFALC